MLCGELQTTHNTHGIPWPDIRYGKREYGKLVDRMVRWAAVNAMRNIVATSPKLCLLRNSTEYGTSINEWQDTDQIKVVARAKLSCLPEFGADWGQDVHCECGARDTFRHASDPAGCDRYGVARAAFPNRLTDDREMLGFGLFRVPNHFQLALCYFIDFHQL